MNEPPNGRKPKWSLAVYQGAIRAGLTKRQAEVLAVYVESPRLAVAADRLGISEQTAKNHMKAIRTRLHVTHLGAVVAEVLTA